MKIEKQAQAVNLFEKLTGRAIDAKKVKVAIVRNRNNQMVAVWYYFDAAAEKQYWLDEYGTSEVHDGLDGSVQLLIGLIAEDQVTVRIDGGPMVIVEKRDGDYFMSSEPFSRWSGH